ncbi:phosphonate C-P lyase system protein PhnG [Rippkaea orientalis PCC 8801]|uniref:Phosphonate C-P lyase system protein PhnG n=1 Tax=Rippkaea orientalis (strain PCC 8801 / RF-1) TaxID=41431 RepID=B7JZV5_RIPO1|nr:phosphonate C-P lyase system protein PhnG [Rippkaea orientalis]ACK65048.1 phosphonate C-P lyase system protein PhnG [Rippkaea orientalis PCC 8801]
MTIPPRSSWIRALTAHPNTIVQDLAEKLTQNWQLTYQSLPQTGLSLLPLEDGVFHQPYYLGEIPLTQVSIELKNDQNQSFAGASQLMENDPDFALALAVCDAIMAHQLPGSEEVLKLINQGLEKRALEDQIKSAILAKTKVNFSLLSQEEADAND